MFRAATGSLAALFLLLAGCRAGMRVHHDVPWLPEDPPSLVAVAPEPPPPPPRDGPCVVTAKRYRTCVVESAVEAARGGGRSIEELYFPEQGVVANLTYELQKEGDREVWRPVLNAFHGEIRNEYGPWCGPNAAPSTVEDVEVPEGLAAQIFEAADLRGRVDAARRAAGTRLSAAGILREVPAPRPDAPATDVAPAKTQASR